MSKTNGKALPEILADAEKLVSSVQDLELRKIAFAKVLDTILGDPAPRSTSAPTNPQSAEVQVDTSTPKRSGPQSYIEELVVEQFFASPKSISDVKDELADRGHHIALTSLSGPMQKLCQRKKLRRQRQITEGREVFMYSNW